MSHPGHFLLQKLASQAGVPAGAHLQIADRCNHACQHCYQVQGRKGELSLEELKAVLDDLAASGVMLLNISGGEATLREDFLDILRYARSKGFALRLFTNGYTMTPLLATELRQVGVLGVDVSVYSDTPEQHDAITRVPGSFRKTLAGIRALLEAGIRVHLKAPATSLVPDAGTRVERLAKELGHGTSVVTSMDITPMEHGDLSTKALSPSPEELLANGALKPWAPKADPVEAMHTARKERSCGACKDGVAILSNGDLRPCTDIVAPLGNLTKRKFLDIYKEASAGLVSSLTWNDIHGCRDCELLPACERCHAAASHEAGDLLGPYASGCMSATTRYRGSVGEVKFLPPAEGCEPNRSPKVGPFRIVEPGVLQAIPDRLTAEDEERRRKFPWIQPTREFLEEMSFGDTPSDIVRRRLPLVRSASLRWSIA